MTARSNTGLLGAILTLGFSWVIARVPFNSRRSATNQIYQLACNRKCVDRDLTSLNSTTSIVLVRCNPGLLGKRAIDCKFVFDKLVEFLCAHLHWLHAELRKSGSNGRRLQCLFYLRIRPIDDIRRGPGGREYAEPEPVGRIGITGLKRGQHICELRCARRTADDQWQHLA